jgi:hypothetical protein
MRHTSYTKISKNKLHNLLTKRNLPLNTIEQIKEDVTKRKKQINKQRIENKVRYRRWCDLIRPLTNHINIIKINTKYHAKHNPELHLFYLAYLDCLLNTRHILNTYKQKREATPINTDRTKRDWTDWVDSVEKAKLLERYEAIPYRTKFSTKRKLFPRPKQLPKQLTQQEKHHEDNGNQ